MKIKTHNIDQEKNEIHISNRFRKKAAENQDMQ
jgi:hypothetical protein